MQGAAGDVCVGGLRCFFLDGGANVGVGESVGGTKMIER